MKRRSTYKCNFFPVFFHNYYRSRFHIITDSSITLNDAGTGVRIVLTYVDEATADSHRAAFADEIAAKDYDVTIVSEETTE